MKEIIKLLNNINLDNKDDFLEFFFKLLQETEKEIFTETHYINIDNFGIHFKKEFTRIRIYIFSKKLSNKCKSMGIIPEENAIFVISSYNNDCIKFEITLDSLRSDLKDNYLRFTPNPKVIDYYYKIFFTLQKDKKIISLYEYSSALNNNNIFDVKKIKIKEKEEKCIVDILYRTEDDSIWLSESLQELNLDKNLLVFDREEIKNKRMTCLSDFLDDQSLFLIEAKYI